MQAPDSERRSERRYIATHVLAALVTCDSDAWMNVIVDRQSGQSTVEWYALIAGQFADALQSQLDMREAIDGAAQT
jgi:hypothetical protein